MLSAAKDLINLLVFWGLVYWLAFGAVKQNPFGAKREFLDNNIYYYWLE